MAGKEISEGPKTVKAKRDGRIINSRKKRIKNKRERTKKGEEDEVRKEQKEGERLSAFGQLKPRE